MIKRGPVSYVENNDNPMGSLIVCLGDGLESILTGGVPNVKLYGFIIDVDIFDLKVDPDCGEEGLVENVICESQ